MHVGIVEVIFSAFLVMLAISLVNLYTPSQTYYERIVKTANIERIRVAVLKIVSSLIVESIESGATSLEGYVIFDNRVLVKADNTSYLRITYLGRNMYVTSSNLKDMLDPLVSPNHINVEFNGKAFTTILKIRVVRGTGYSFTVYVE